MAFFTPLTVDASNLEGAGKFYDAALHPFSLGSRADVEKASTPSRESVLLMPVTGKPATVGTGAALNFRAPNRASVDGVEQ